MKIITEYINEAGINYYFNGEDCENILVALYDAYRNPETDSSVKTSIAKTYEKVYDCVKELKDRKAEYILNSAAYAKGNIKKANMDL